MAFIMNDVMELVDRIKLFMEDEARSCSMDFGCMTPEYVYRMWGGSVAIDEIATGLTELRKELRWNNGSTVALRVK